MKVTCFDAGQAGFPPAKLPVLPPASLGAVRWLARDAVRGPAQKDLRFRHYQRGRYALRSAYILAGARAGDGLLLPAYHCRTMLDPALALGLQPLLYAVTPSLQPDLPQLEAQLRRTVAAGSRARALVLTHFFGFAQPTAELQALCHRHGLELIEDCSHALLLDPADNDSPAVADGIGLTARIGVASPYKFLACQDGGLLWAATALATGLPEPVAATWGAECRAGARLLSDALRPRPAELPQVTTPGWDGDPQAAPDLVLEASQPSDAYDMSAQSMASLASTRWLMRHTPLAPVVARRRRRYAQWLQAVRNLPGCCALFPEPGPATVPYMFPLLLDQPWPAFHRLKHAGVPIWRWDQMAVSDCKVATDYRLRLLHLPCHQGLSDAQMDWMTATLTAVMTAPPRSAENR